MEILWVQKMPLCGRGVRLEVARRSREKFWDAGGFGWARVQKMGSNAAQVMRRRGWKSLALGGKCDETWAPTRAAGGAGGLAGAPSPRPGRPPHPGALIALGRPYPLVLLYISPMGAHEPRAHQDDQAPLVRALGPRGIMGR